MIDNYNKNPCVGSGLCCKTGSCPYGQWDAIKHSCKFLETSLSGNNFEIYRCGRYEYIKQQKGNELVPAFGAGCCMSLFNDNRKNIIKELKNNNKDVIMILKN